MLKSAKDCERFRIQTSDGDIGHVEDFLFDDEKRAVRYLVVNTGMRLLGRKVLLSPLAVTEVNWAAGEISVNLTKEQVQNSPDIDLEMPVSREHEMQLLRYYNWPEYWSGTTSWREDERPTLQPIETESEKLSDVQRPAPFLLTPEGSEMNPHLRSIKELRGYRIDARRKIFGHVEDAVLDFTRPLHGPQQGWPLRYLKIDTRNWWPSLPVAISTEWISGISWEQSLIHVDLDENAIKTAPELKTGIPLEREYEEKLHRHYGKLGYWEGRKRPAA